MNMRTFLSAIFALVMFLLPSVAFAALDSWTVQHRTDKWTDERYVYAIVQAPDESFVVVVCEDDHVWAQVRIGTSDWSPHKTRKVRWRVDSKVPYDEEWRQSVEESGVVVSGLLALEFADLIARADNQLLFKNSTGTRTFSVRGSNEAIGVVMAACGES
jgi:hypothetical protein